MKKCNLVSCGIMSYIFSIHYLSIIYKEFSIIFLKVRFSKTKKVVHICIGLARVAHSKWAYKSSKNFNNCSKNVTIQINIVISTLMKNFLEGSARHKYKEISKLICISTHVFTELNVFFPFIISDIE